MCGPSRTDRLQVTISGAESASRKGRSWSNHLGVAEDYHIWTLSVHPTLICRAYPNVRRRKMCALSGPYRREVPDAAWHAWEPALPYHVSLLSV